jgi:hypothetical protein
VNMRERVSENVRVRRRMAGDRVSPVRGLIVGVEGHTVDCFGIRDLMAEKADIAVNRNHCGRRQVREMNA